MTSGRCFTAVWVGLAVVTALVFFCGSAARAQAQITLDGTVGPAGALAGPNYVIPETVAARSGGNLFHSFGRFNIGTGESATFTGPSDIRHVISRVTGGDPSSIDGMLRSQVGRADFWFLNPAGVVFGPNAWIDVPAAFHVSTAEEVRFADGAKFSATNPATSGLSVAAPEAFGFLRPNPAGIAVNGSTLQTRAGQTLSVIAGDLQVTGGRVASEGGQVHLVAMAGPGTVRAADSTPSVPARGAVRLAPDAQEQGARVDTSGDGGGRIAIRGGQIEVAGSQVLANNTGTWDAADGIEVVGDTISATTGGMITSTSGRGKAGRVAVQAHTLTLDDSVIASATLAQGEAGTVAVRVNSLELHNRSIIGSPTFAQGRSGTVAVEAEKVLIDGNARITTATAAEGYAGTVAVTTGDLVMQSGLIDSSTTGSGDAGTVSITARGSIEVRNGGEIRSSTFAQGHAGTVTIHAETGGVTVHNGGLIRSDAYGQGNAGTVTIHADRLLVSGDGAQQVTGIVSGTYYPQGQAGDTAGGSGQSYAEKWVTGRSGGIL